LNLRWAGEREFEFISESQANQRRKKPIHGKRIGPSLGISEAEATISYIQSAPDNILRNTLVFDEYSKEGKEKQ
jgi:hypothetical protein